MKRRKSFVSAFLIIIAALQINPIYTDASSYSTGDVNGDGVIDAVDASSVLSEYAVISTSGIGSFSDEQRYVADVNLDNIVDAIDASGVLSYYAYIQTGGTDTIHNFINPDSNIIIDGTYVVGENVEAGEYCIIKKSFAATGNVSIYSDESETLDSLIVSKSFAYNCFIEVEEGQHIKLTDAVAYPANEAKISTDGDGMFRVGTDIVPGEYRISKNSDTPFGSYTIYNECSVDAVAQSGNLVGSSTYVEVASGQYLELKQCTAVLTYAAEE